MMCQQFDGLPIKAIFEESLTKKQNNFLVLKGKANIVLPECGV